jgi:glycosyltransferase involved in cell wall biosynthesis
MQKTRKVLMLVENISVPPDPRVWAEATTLRDAGYQVSIICPKGSKIHCEPYICREQVYIYRYGLPQINSKSLAYIIEYSLALLMTFILSFKVWRRHGFDVIHTANPPDIFFLIALFYRCFGKKFVFDQHDLAPEMFQVIFPGRLKSLCRLLFSQERWSYKCADVVITANISFKKLALERGGCSAKKVFVVRNGPDLRRFKLDSPARDLPFCEKRRYLLAYVGVVGKQDGVEYVLYALHHLVYKRGREDVGVVLMGDGSSIQELKELVHQLKLDAYILFTGWVEKQEMLSYLALADIGLSPDPQNGLNEFCTMIKTMEYMAMSLPIVAFDLAETRFSAQGAALYARPNEVEDFAQNIEILLDNEALRQSMGIYGQQRIVDTLSWEHSQKSLLAAYETLFAGVAVRQAVVSPVAASLPFPGSVVEFATPFPEKTGQSVTSSSL